jgi:hypothetical protein
MQANHRTLEIFSNDAFRGGTLESRESGLNCGHEEPCQQFSSPSTLLME